MFMIAGGLVLGGIGLVAAFFVIAFIVMYLAEAWNILVAKIQRRDSYKPPQFPLKIRPRIRGSDPASHRTR